MPLVLKISTVLGLTGVIAAFALFYLGERVFHMDHDHIQTLMYLKLSVAGHMTIFLTRTRGPLWSIRPAKALLIAVLGTQTVATLIAVYGLFMTPLGWGLAAFVWGYAVVWALFTDRVKLLAYRIFDPIKTPEAKAKPEVKEQPEATAQPESKTQPEARGKLDLKTSSPTLKLVKQVHDFYEKLGREDVREVQKWDKDEQDKHRNLKNSKNNQNK
jgi:H+-transporting ATPase